AAARTGSTGVRSGAQRRVREECRRSAGRRSSSAPRRLGRATRTITPIATSRARAMKTITTRGRSMPSVCLPRRGCGGRVRGGARHIRSAELGEPDADLAGGGLLGVGAVHEVLDDGEVLLAG